MLTRRNALTLFATAPMAYALASPAWAREPEIYNEGGVAIDGSDAVAYFTQGRPVEGSADHTLMWKGVEWRFANAQNRAAFEADPMAYAPQYGGYCAWAAAEGYVASTRPDAWTIHDGKLYLNFNRRIRRRWERDIPGNVARGDANWPGILG
ncbi:YHS domain-containing (seleno)protein [Roseobacteraceae bacterium S113]